MQTPEIGKPARPDADFRLKEITGQILIRLNAENQRLGGEVALDMSKDDDVQTLLLRRPTHHGTGRQHQKVFGIDSRYGPFILSQSLWEDFVVMRDQAYRVVVPDEYKTGHKNLDQVNMKPVCGLLDVDEWLAAYSESVSFAQREAEIETKTREAKLASAEALLERLSK